MHRRKHARLVEMRDGSMAFFSSYDPRLVVELKARIPSTERKWDPDGKCWRVAARHAQTCADIALDCLGLTVQVPIMVVANHMATTQLLKLEYLGAAKDRGGGEPTAYGWHNGGWNAVFPLSVLRNWFEVGDETPAPDAAITLYGVLGVARKAGRKEIKGAYRRAARTWHPDRSDEPDAAEQFRRIHKAYKVLSDPAKRARYNAGLTLTATLKHDKLPFSHKIAAHWKSPLRTGYILVECTEQLGRLVVSRILQWGDVVNVNGQVMVSFWPKGADHFKTDWVAP